MKFSIMEPPHALSFATKEAKVFFALSPWERGAFFPGLDGAVASGQQWLEDAHRLDQTEWEELLRSINPEVLVTGWTTPSLPVAWIAEATCSLRYVCHLAGSVRRLLPRFFLEAEGRLVTNWGDQVGALVAEHALLLALSALRNQKAWESYMGQPFGERPSASLYCRTRTLFGARVGIHGFGGVARALLKLLAPFNVTVSAYSDGVPTSMIQKEDVHPCASLEELFVGSDILFECEALTIANKGSVTAKLLKKLPEGAVFVNVARGALIEKGALLAEGHRIRVAVDVCDEGPMTLALPTLKLPGAIVSPHIAGPTFDRYPQLGIYALENIKRYGGGLPLESPVTLEAYDRAT